MSKYCCDRMGQALNKRAILRRESCDDDLAIYRAILDEAFPIDYCPFCGAKLHQDNAPKSEKSVAPADKCRAAANNYVDLADVLSDIGDAIETLQKRVAKYEHAHEPNLPHMRKLKPSEFDEV